MPDPNTALQRVDTGAPSQPVEAAPSAVGTFTRDQVELIKRTVAEGTSDDELALFLEVCRSTGLNPFQRQIYAIMRDTWNPSTRQREPKMTIQTGIDGYRLIAARTGAHLGTDDIEYGPMGAEGPEWARVTVYRLVAGQRAAFTATARWDEYCQRKRARGGADDGPSGMWEKMGHTMLGKCAESLALRRAFPAELSGVYTREEMSQATVEDADVVSDRPAPRRRERSPERRMDFPGEDLYAGPPRELPEAEAPVLDAPHPDDVTRAYAERMELIDTADAETLHRWFDDAREWPRPYGLDIRRAIHAQANRFAS